MDDSENIRPLSCVSGVSNEIPRDKNESFKSEESDCSEIPDEVPKDKHRLAITERNYLQYSRKVKDEGPNSSLEFMSSSGKSSGVHNSNSTLPETVWNNQNVPLKKKLQSTTRRVFRCRGCNYSSFNFETLKLHLLKHTDVSTISTNSSDTDSTVLYFRFKHDEEMTSEVYNADNLYTCNECSFETHEVKALDSHLNIHSWLKEVAKSKSKDLSPDSEKPRYFLRYRPPKVKKYGKALTKQSAPEKFFCKNCKFSCDEWCTLLRHQAVHAAKSQPLDDKTTKISPPIFDCWQDDCSFFCDNLDVFKRHQEFHEEKFQKLFDRNQKEPKFNCRMCGFSCAEQELIVLHETVHSGSFQTPEEFEQTKNSKEKNVKKFFSCDICSFICIKRITFHNHLDIHLRNSQHGKATVPAEEKFECDICPFTSVRKETLVRHFNRHYEEDVVSDESSQSEFCCGICPAIFPTEKKLLSHEKSHAALSKEYEEMQNEPQIFKCKKCPNSYSVKLYLDLHQSTHNVRYKCAFCGRGYNKLYAFKRHTKICKVKD